MLFPDQPENFTGPWYGSTDDWRSSISSHGSSEASPPPLSSCPDLILASINLRKTPFTKQMDCRVIWREDALRAFARQ
jgi:hypothetical protein